MNRVTIHFTAAGDGGLPQPAIHEFEDAEEARRFFAQAPQHGYVRSSSDGRVMQAYPVHRIACVVAEIEPEPEASGQSAVAVGSRPPEPAS